MKQRFFLLCGFFLTLLQAVTPLSAQTDPATPAVPKIIILPARVTVDGVPRADLGQFLSDIISARLLTSSAAEVLDADMANIDFPSTGGPATTMEASPDQLGAAAFPDKPAPAPASAPASGNPASASGFVPGAAARSPLATGIAMGANLVVQPTALGTGNEFRLTLREIQIPGGKVLAIISEKTNTGLKGLYALAENHAHRLIPARPAGPRLASGPSIIDHPASYRPDPVPAPAHSPITEQELAAAPAALAKLSPAKQAALDATMRLLDPAARTAGPTPIGRIGGLNAAWSFCEISLKQPLELPVGTALFTTAAGNPESVVDLRVSRLEGRKIIADFDAGPRAATLRTGDIVYHWKP